MEKQAIDDILKPGDREYRSVQDKYLGRKFSLEIATKDEIYSMSGKLQVLVYPFQIFISEVPNQFIEKLLKHPDAKYVPLHNRGKSLHGIILNKEFGYSFGGGLKRAARAYFTEVNHCIKTIKLGETMIYTSPFVDTNGFYQGLCNGSLREINMLRKEKDFPVLHPI